MGGGGRSKIGVFIFLCSRVVKRKVVVVHSITLERSKRYCKIIIIV